MSTASFLPPEAIRSALDTLELLQAMYPLPDELSLLQPPSASQLALLRAIVESTPPGPLPTTLPPYIRMIIRIGIDSDAGGGDEGEGRYSMELEVGIPLMKGIETSLYLRQPSWMSKGRYGELVESLPEKTNHGEGEDNTVEDVLLRVEKVKEEGARYLPEKTPEPVLGGGYEVEPDENGMDRVWFWLPSLSTREKRNDITSGAPSWKLTGFVLAGKPGILCLEGSPKAIDAFMNWIKSVSWSDIPSFQKKITERHRELGIETRLFTGMVEITDLVEHRGHHGNRGEMGQVRAWIEERGVGSEVLGKVLNLG